MAMSNCSDCGTQVSDRAQACPNCGAPLTESSIQLNRAKKFSGSLARWYVAVDGMRVESLANGESVTITRPSGFTVEVGPELHINIATSPVSIRVAPRQHLRVALKLGMMGVKATNV